MTKLVLACLLSLLAVAYTQEPLQCYNCTTKDCDFDKATNKISCGKGKLISGVDGVPACLKFVYKEKSGEKQTIRKCVLLDPKDKNFKCALQPGATEEFCGTCQEKLCNGAEGVKFNVYNIITATALSLLLVKFFL